MNSIELMNELEKRGLKAEEIFPGEIKVFLNKENFINHLSYLRGVGFCNLPFMSGVDYINDNEFEVVYHVYSYEDKIHVLAKVRIPRDNPEIGTVTGLWEQAQFYEQEIHEFFGIYFQGNNDLTHLFLENFLDIPPLRKDFDTREYSIKAFGANIQGESVGGCK